MKHPHYQKWLRRYVNNRPAVCFSPGTKDRYSAILPLLVDLSTCTDAHLLVTIDGPCASGKTTFAAQFASILGAPVVHMDDFVIPHAQKTAERLSIPGGNADVDRLLREVLHPWLHDEPVAYRPYLCKEDAFGEPVTLPRCSCLVLEGSYCNLPEIAQHASMRLFLKVSPDEQQRRLLQRGGEASLKRFNEMWIPLEKAYFEAYGLPDSRCYPLR